jgi:uncharacterized phage-associated protein
MAIEFRFHPEKAVAAAAILLKLHGQPMKYLGLLKMLYIADRLALQQLEQPITGDHYVSMNYGPVLSGVYDLLKGKPVAQALPLWSRYISPRINATYVKLLSDPGSAELCEAEEEILQTVYQTFGQMDPFDVAEWTHDLPEWHNPYGSALPIAVEDVLNALGKTAAEIAEIAQEALREAHFDGALQGEYCY